MKNNPADTNGRDERRIERETLWQTLAGCGLVWAGLLVLWWVL
jgi:hypothetical protein